MASLPTTLRWSLVVGSLSHLRLRFQTSDFDSLVDEVCSSWEGTRYQHGKCAKGIAVDCIHFGAAVLDELYGMENSKNLRSLPPDACVHNRRGVEIATRSLLRAYPMRRVEDSSLEAGDLLILGPWVEGRPAAAGHLMVAGSCGTLWHATVPKVVKTGYSIPSTEALLAVYRAQDKDKWHARTR